MTVTRDTPNPSSFADALTNKHHVKKGRVRKKLAQQRQKSIDWLRKKGGERKSARRLADKFEDCSRRRRCKSLACPECANAAGRLFVKMASDYFEDRHGVVCVTIVPGDGAIAPGALIPAELERFIRRTKDKLGRAGVETFIGTVDWSMNESKTNKHEPFWSLHIHGMTTARDLKGLKKALKKQFPKAPNVGRPITVKEWDGDLAAIRYLIKPPSTRRISIENAKRFDRNRGSERTCRDTDKQPLRSRDKMELLLHLDDIGTAGRLFLKGVQFMNLSDRGPTLVTRLSRSRNRKND